MYIAILRHSTIYSGCYTNQASYDRLLKYANAEFVSESFFRGYGFDVIKKNSDYIVKAATKKKVIFKIGVAFQSYPILY